MAYTPVTKADLAKGYPAPSWNQGPAISATRAARAASSAANAPLAAAIRQAFSTLPAAARAHAQPVSYATAAGVDNTLQHQSSSGGGHVTPAAVPTAAPAAGRTSGQAPSSKAWAAALQQLFSSRGSEKLKWRAILPNNDRVGAFSSADMLGWLAGSAAGRKSPKGVGSAEARAVEKDPGALLVCGIVGTDYNAQRLPGGWGQGVHLACATGMKGCFGKRE